MGSLEGSNANLIQSDISRIAKSLERIADVLEGSVQRWGNVDGICVVNANDILQDQIEDMKGLAELRKRFPDTE